MPVVLILAVITIACSGNKPVYLDKVTVDNTGSVDALPQVGVSFDQESLPAATTSKNNAIIFLISQSQGQNEAKEYHYALFSGPLAAKGEEACIGTDYSDFVPLKDPIIIKDLSEGTHLLCARGKSAAGIVQQENKATTFTWKVDPDATLDKEPPNEPTDDDNLNINVVVNFPGVPQQQSQPQPMPKIDPPPDPMAKMQVRKNNNSGVLSHAFSHGEETVVPYYIHNTGNADLNWSLRLDTQDAGWLKIEYGGETKIGNAIAFSGILAANSVSSPLEISLALDSNKRVDDKYLAIQNVNGNSVEKDEYVVKLTFTNKNTDATAATSAAIYLWIPRLKLKKDTPARRHAWRLPIQNGDHDWKKILIEKHGKGNLSWQNIKTDYNRFDVQFSNPPDGGYLQFRLRSKGRTDNKAPSDGDHTHVGVISNGGSTYTNQSVPGLHWFYVCVVSGNVNANTECPDHNTLSPHH